ncbi:MAG: 4-hydroxybenzoate octaprenyltransferase [Bacteroidetes bacterium HGW-Bacteroidetes-6]|jgi:4-hydroxybenzoate polyprenyltransferase|nr:MAG: 4-hydroxybenzoate octaprenyltransferase [Bacteroidetes bacterium HGW-Bacteroidetes-6]
MKYFKLIKFSHTIFSLPFALIGFLLATKQAPMPTWPVVMFIVLALVAARTAAMAFNRWADYRWDGKNPRTKNREIPTGIIKPAQALTLAITASVVFVILAGLINEICLFLSPVALIIILGYSYTKRFTSLAHVVLGVGLGIAPAATYIAVSGMFEPGLLLLCFGVMFWVAGFDIIYALQDMEFDREHKLHSIPVWLEYSGSLRLAAIFHLLTIGLMFLYIHYIDGGWYAMVGGILFSLLIVYQHIDVHRNGLKKVNMAFGTLNGVASLIFGLGYVLEYFY